MLIETQGDLYSAWSLINLRFLEDDTLPLSIVKSAGVYASLPMITMKARGITEGHTSKLFRPARLHLLWERYIDRDVWQQCVKRYRAAPTGASHTFLFNRTGPRPKAGGCLLSLVFVRHNKQWQLMITSRAEEITMALYADIKFIEACLIAIEDTLNMRLDIQSLPITWHIGLAHQNRTFVPVFVYDYDGKGFFNSWMQRRRKPDSKWDKICVDHTRLMLKGEKVTGARKLWGKRLKEWTK